MTSVHKVGPRIENSTSDSIFLGLAKDTIQASVISIEAEWFIVFRVVAALR